MSKLKQEEFYDTKLFPKLNYFNTITNSGFRGQHNK